MPRRSRRRLPWRQTNSVRLRRRSTSYRRSSTPYSTAPRNCGRSLRRGTSSSARRRLRLHAARRRAAYHRPPVCAARPAGGRAADAREGDGGVFTRPRAHAGLGTAEVLRAAMRTHPIVCLCQPRALCPDRLADRPRVAHKDTEASDADHASPIYVARLWAEPGANCFKRRIT